MEETNKNKLNSRKKKTWGWKLWLGIAAGVIVLVFAASAGVYIKKGQQYKSVYFPNTIINGVDASLKTVDEVKKLIGSNIDGYSITIEKRGNQAEEIAGREILLQSVFDGSLETILAAQNPNDWWKHRKESSNFEIGTLIQFDQDAFQETLSGLEFMNSETVILPADAYLSEYIPGIGYKVVPETPGTQVNTEMVKKGIGEAVMNLKTSVSLEELGCYTEPAITSDEEGLNALATELNKYVGVTVTHTFGNASETLKGDTIAGWISVAEDKTVNLDAAKVTAYVKSLGEKYNTYNKAKNLKTSYGSDVKISGGTYGWKINQGAETEELMKIIRSGESQTREPVYSQKAASHGENDFGSTYVEINLTAQHLYFYKEGKLLVESDFVSGNLAKGYGTPAGAFPLNYKQRNAVLKGEDYRTPVDYWMPFNGGIGLHDAKWRSSFGGSIYKTSGSHGCINLPPAVAKTIYDNISSGMPVLCYNLEGTQSGSSSPAKPPETKVPPTTAARPETTPPETTLAPAETAPAQSTSAPSSQAVPETTAPPTSKPVETPPSPAPDPSKESQPSRPYESQFGPGIPSSGSKKEVGPGVP